MNKLEEKVLDTICFNDHINISMILDKFHLMGSELNEVLVQLEKYGYRVNKDYYNDGKILLSVKHCREEKRILMNPASDILHFVAISDTHFGYRKKSSIDFLYEIRRYCKKNRIYTVCHLGDVVDGVCYTKCSDYQSIKEQFETLLKQYPSDPKIHTYFLFGNHDISDKTFDPYSFMKDKRLDFIPLAIENGVIHVNREKIGLCHSKVFANDEMKLVLKGHSHHYDVKNPGNGFLIKVPSLSNINPNSKGNLVPGFLDIRLKMGNGFFRDLLVDQIILLDDFYKVSSAKLQFPESPSNKCKSKKKK